MLVILLIVNFTRLLHVSLLKKLLDNNERLAIHHRPMEVFSMSPVMLQTERASISSISSAFNYVIKTQANVARHPLCMYD